MDSDQNTQQEIYRLTKENNRLLRKMRRNTLIVGIIKFLLYMGLLIVLPVWLYSTYLAPILESTMQTVGQIQGVGEGAQEQLGSLQEALQKFDLTGYFRR